MANNFALDYIDVATRIADFRRDHPTGSLQQVSVDFRDFAGGSWIVFTAAAYRSPDDERPGIGTAWEPVPGKTNFTRDSELQNAETAAWGRAIVAALAGDTKKSIASAEEVRNRHITTDTGWVADIEAAITAVDSTASGNAVWGRINAGEKSGKATADDATRLRDDLKAHVKALPKETPSE